MYSDLPVLTDSKEARRKARESLERLEASIRSKVKVTKLKKKAKTECQSIQS